MVHHEFQTQACAGVYALVAVAAIDAEDIFVEDLLCDIVALLPIESTGFGNHTCIEEGVEGNIPVLVDECKAGNFNPRLEVCPSVAICQDATLEDATNGVLTTQALVLNLAEIEGSDGLLEVEGGIAEGLLVVQAVAEYQVVANYGEELTPSSHNATIGFALAEEVGREATHNLGAVATGGSSLHIAGVVNQTCFEFEVGTCNLIIADKTRIAVELVERGCALVLAELYIVGGHIPEGHTRHPGKPVGDATLQIGNRTQHCAVHIVPRTILREVHIEGRSVAVEAIEGGHCRVEITHCCRKTQTREEVFRVVEHMCNGLAFGVVREFHIELVEIGGVGATVTKVEEVAQYAILKSEVGVVANCG